MVDALHSILLKNIAQALCAAVNLREAQEQHGQLLKNYLAGSNQAWALVRCSASVG